MSEEFDQAEFNRFVLKFMKAVAGPLGKEPQADVDAWDARLAPPPQFREVTYTRHNNLLTRDDTPQFLVIRYDENDRIVAIDGEPVKVGKYPVCPHGEDPAQCNECMIESDLAYDAARERR